MLRKFNELYFKLVRGVAWIVKHRSSWQYV